MEWTPENLLTIFWQLLALVERLFSKLHPLVGPLDAPLKFESKRQGRETGSTEDSDCFPSHSSASKPGRSQLSYLGVMATRVGAVCDGKSSEDEGVESCALGKDGALAEERGAFGQEGRDFVFWKGKRFSENVWERVPLEKRTMKEERDKRH